MADTCTRCADAISDRTPAEGYTTRIGLTRTRIVWRLSFVRFRWHWLPKHADERVSRFYTELDLCDWCTGDVFLFAQGLPPRPPRVVTPSQADKQPPASPSDAKGGETPVAPGTTKHPDLVTHHEPGARTPEVAEPRPASGCCRAEGISSEGGPASREHGASTSGQEST